MWKSGKLRTKAMAVYMCDIHEANVRNIAFGNSRQNKIHVQVNSQSVPCRVFQTCKVFDYQHYHVCVTMHSLTVYQAHILHTLWFINTWQ